MRCPARGAGANERERCARVWPSAPPAPCPPARFTRRSCPSSMLKGYPPIGGYPKDKPSMPPDPTTRPRPAMVRDPHAYTLVRTIATRDAPGQSVRCDRCGTRILDPARVGSDPVALASLRHGDVILDDTAYVVRGPDGERSLCLRCVEHAGITRESKRPPPPRRPPAPSCGASAGHSSPWPHP